MTIAESVIKEYLERGYSLEALRVLAESREQPLGGEMLAIIETMAATPEVSAAAEDSGPCETAAYPVARGEGDSVFFVADDEELMSEAGAVDFDVMAGTAAEEESVAEILVGETLGSDVVESTESPFSEVALSTLDTGAGDSDIGVWSRLWSRVSGSQPPALAPSVHAREDAGLTFEEDESQTLGAHAIEENRKETPVAEMDGSASEAFCEAVAERAESVEEALVERMQEDPTDRHVQAEEPAIIHPDRQESIPEAFDTGFVKDEFEMNPIDNSMHEDEPVLDEETAEHSVEAETEPAVERAIREEEGRESAETPHFADDIAAQSEISADYIPGSVSELYDGSEMGASEEHGNDVADSPAAEVADLSETNSNVDMEAELRRLREAQEAIAAKESEPEEAPHSDQSAASCEPIAQTEQAPIAEEPQESRRERRRRERAEKKRQKRGKKSTTAEELPEIVLTRSEGTETLSVVDEPELHSESDSNLPVLAAITSDTIADETSAEDDNAPCMSEPMSLLTPNDVINDDSQISEESSQVAPVANVEEETTNDGEDLQPVCSSSGAADEAEATDTESTGEAAPVEPSLFYSGADHLMIIAGGGVTEKECASFLAEDAETDAGATTEEEAEQPDHNVILFSEKFPVFAGVRDEGDDYEASREDVGESAYPVLRMLPPMETALTADVANKESESVFGETAALASSAPATPLLETTQPETAEIHVPDAPKEDYLTETARLALVRAMLGAGPIDECLENPMATESDDHTIVAEEPEPEPDALEREAAVREEMEREYQIRLDEFAARLLDVQGIAAASEARVRDKTVELDAKSAIIEEMQKRLDDEAEKQKTLEDELTKSREETRAKEGELGVFAGMRDEHERLYKEFEDLRRAYNEVVTDVMPGLQGERDDLALTVERQSANENRLRSSLGATRKRLAVGYSLAGAACLALVALPVANWLKSGQSEKQVAMEHQRISDLQETLQREVQQNINAQNVIVELENKVNMARAQIMDLQGKNKELARVNSFSTSQSSQGLAVFRPSEAGATGTPARASEMALQATTLSSGGRLHVNEIRDPAGSIEQTYAMNRQAQPQPDRQMAQASQQSQRPIAMSAVARTDSRPGGLRPGAGVAAASAANSSKARRSETAGAQNRKSAPVAREGEVLAKVKKGEGVAQVVYRELGTWDPEVISWVIRENNITNDKRGNPRIHPDQLLRLPKEGRLNQAASATKRR